MLITDKINVYRINIDWWDWDGKTIDCAGHTLGLIDCGIDTFREQFREWAKETDHISHVRKGCSWSEYLRKYNI